MRCWIVPAPRGDCAAQLDVFLLVLADVNSSAADVRSEAALAERDCPADPTPEWLLGQYFSQEDDVLPNTSPPALATESFQRMASTFPDSPLPLIGQADAALRKGLRLLDTAPFAARVLLRSADRTYQAAARIGGNDPVAFGRARTLIGLSQPHAALDVLNGCRMLRTASRGEPTYSRRKRPETFRVRCWSDAHSLSEARRHFRRFSAAAAGGGRRPGRPFPARSDVGRCGVVRGAHGHPVEPWRWRRRRPDEQQRCPGLASRR